MLICPVATALLPKLAPDQATLKTVTTAEAGETAPKRRHRLVRRMVWVSFIGKAAIIDAVLTVIHPEAACSPNKVTIS
jgi:uncharacterized membrane protein